ncbi:MAG TPA: hypothetical protein PLI05_05905 [Methanotrichaceae archaeon]|nr:hypothetical protein [Methanotrichaceae archaeon]HQI91217.1 hypothetical protein [Methanotrichaceae archaeon]HQJ61735.1 hypothetical protein [Methanothrix soehngenii]
MIPVTAPREVLDALTSVQVHTTAGEIASGFELKFNLSKRSPLNTLFLLSGGSPIPMVRVMIVVTIDGVSETLMDGMMTRHEISPGSGANPSTLTIKGTDLTTAMDYFKFSIPYPAMPPEVRILAILAKYAFLGVIPVVIPSVLTDVPIPVERIPRQNGTDLEYIKQLADEAGYVFYMEPGPVPGTSKAYWGPEVRVGIPQPALNTDFDGHTNVESLNFTFDAESRKQVFLLYTNPAIKVPIPIPLPDISLIKPPLALVPPAPKAIETVSRLSKLSAIQVALTGLSQAAKNADSVTADGSLDVLRYGHILTARGLVGVRGAGEALDGLYFVKSVTHNIKRGEYKQSFTLSRDGLISITSKVPV